ncbi:MAG: YdcF family protein [Verrucomicrobiae bacterium]|nr:YdcF family protein [Verrucomicrobiae bacterium]
MYALLSAIVSFLVQPLTWLLGLLVALIFVRSTKWRRRLGIAALVVAVIFTNPWLHHAVSVRWEPEPLSIKAMEEPFGDAVVLGGFTKLWATPVDRLHLGSDPNRFSQAIELYHLEKVRRLVFVSGGHTTADSSLTEATLAARTAERFGVPKEAIVALGTSRNTHENAEEYRAWREKNSGDATDGDAPFLLVTSAFHARRSAACFRKAGLSEFVIFPTDHRSDRDHPDRKLTLSNTVAPSPGTMLSWGALFREWFGMLVYRVRGWI